MKIKLVLNFILQKNKKKKNKKNKKNKKKKKKIKKKKYLNLKILF